MCSPLDVPLSGDSAGHSIFAAFHTHTDLLSSPPVLSSLICASLTEDRYGVVQRDIPKVLEALTSFLDEVEVTRREINSVTQESAGETIDGEKDDGLSEKTLQQRLEVEKANEVLGIVGNGVSSFLFSSFSIALFLFPSSFCG